MKVSISEMTCRFGGTAATCVMLTQLVRTLCLHILSRINIGNCLFDLGDI